MSFIWSRKVKQTIQPQHQVKSQVQVSILELKEDKISVEEHKNGESLVISCEGDNEVGEREEGINGQEVVLPCIEDSEVVISQE